MDKKPFFVFIGRAWDFLMLFPLIHNQPLGSLKPTLLWKKLEKKGNTAQNNF